MFLTRRKSKKNGIKVKDEYSCEFTQYLMPKSIDNRTKKAPKNWYLEITLIVTDNGNVKKPVISYKGIPEKSEDNTFLFDVEDEIMNICRTFSIDNKKQQQNLIETLKQNCRRIVIEKTGKKPFTNINIARI